MLVGTNLGAWPGAAAGGGRWGEYAAARSNKGPIIAGMVTRMNDHGYPLVKHCSKMERLPKHLNPLPAWMGFASGRRLPEAAAVPARCLFTSAVVAELVDAQR